MIVASTIVPVPMRMPLPARYRFTAFRILPHSSCSSSRWRNRSTGVSSGAGRRPKSPPPRKAPQHRRFIERLFHPGIQKIEPSLQKVSSQHDSQTHRLATVAGPDIIRLDQRLQFPLRNHTVHGNQKLLPLTLPSTLLGPSLRRQRYLSHRAP